MKIRDESIFELTAKDIVDLIDQELNRLGYKRLTMTSEILPFGKKVKVVKGTALKFEDKLKTLN